MKKKKALVISLIGLLLLGTLIWYLYKQKDNSTIKPPIDIGEIEETSFKWEDIATADISGFEGDIIVNLTYKEIPDLKKKIEAEEEKWNNLKDTLDPYKDAQLINDYYTWLSEIRNAYDEAFCHLPSDLNNYKNGDTIKITCDSEILRQLNYKFNDGFTVKIENVVARLDDEVVKEKQTIDKPIDNSIKEENNTDITNVENVYEVIGDTFVVSVRNLDTVNLFEINNKDQRVLIDVKSEEDFNKVKQHALTYGNIDYIQYNDEVYYASSEFMEANEWKGFTQED